MSLQLTATRAPGRDGGRSGLTGPGAPSRHRPQLLSDSRGRIAHLALQYGGREFGAPLRPQARAALLATYRQLFRELSPQTRFTVLVPDAPAATQVRQAALASGMTDPGRVRTVPTEGTDLSVWIRDSMLPMSAGRDGTVLLRQHRTYYPGGEDRRAAEVLDRWHDGVTARKAPHLCVDGGNVLVHAGRAFVGADSRRQTAERLKARAEAAGLPELVRGAAALGSGPEVPWSGERNAERGWEELAVGALERAFGRPVEVVCQRAPQPVFHIDMAMTPVGPRDFLVGDPKRGVQLLSAMPRSEQLASAAPYAEAAGVAPQDILDGLVKESSQPELARRFEALAGELRSQGFRVSRVPFLAAKRHAQAQPCVTFNNCLQESYQDPAGRPRRKVFLPQSGFRALDEAARATYRRFGYQVVPLPLGQLLPFEGAVRCASHPLERTQH